MTFEEWWMTLLPAEVDELKPIFESCWIEAWTGGAKEEREACAKVCETGDIHEAQIPTEWLTHADPSDDEEMTRLYCAAAIRMRSNVKVTG